MEFKVTLEQLNQIVDAQLDIKLAELGVTPALVSKNKAYQIIGSRRLVDNLIASGEIHLIEDEQTGTMRIRRKQLLEVCTSNIKYRSKKRKN